MASFSAEARKKWLVKRKLEANRHQGQFPIPGSGPQASLQKEVLKNLDNSFFVSFYLFQHVVFSRNVLQAVGVTSLPLGALGRYQTFFGYLWP